jgi:hypothetical protein
VVYGIERDIDWSSFSRKSVLNGNDSTFARRRTCRGWHRPARVHARRYFIDFAFNSRLRAKVGAQVVAGQLSRACRPA